MRKNSNHYCVDVQRNEKKSSAQRLFYRAYIPFFILIACTFTQAKTLSDTTFAFKMNVESQWNLTYDSSDTGVYYLRDATKQKKAEISIRRIKVDTISILAESEYAKVYFLSSLIIARGYGTVKHWDSAVGLSVGDLRAYDLYAHYKSTIGSVTKWYAEYARWCSQDTNLFELSIMCDDVNEITMNSEYYSALLNSITVWAPGKYRPTIIKPKKIAIVENKTAIDNSLFDLAGRILSPMRLPHKKGVSQCEIYNGKIQPVFSGITTVVKQKK